MQTNAATTVEHESPENDLGPLAWVLDELKKSLDGATKAMRRFVRDAELARGSDLAATSHGLVSPSETCPKYPDFKPSTGEAF